MTRISGFTFKAEPGQTIHSFSEELCKLYDRLGRDIVGVFNDVILDVNEYENPRSLFWQYQYKKEVR